MKKFLFIYLSLFSCAYYHGNRSIVLYNKSNHPVKEIILKDYDKFFLEDSLLCGSNLIISKSGVVHKYEFNASLLKKNGKINTKKIRFWYYKHTHTAEIIKDSLDFYTCLFQLKSPNTDSIFFEYRNKEF